MTTNHTPGPWQAVIKEPPTKFKHISLRTVKVTNQSNEFVADCVGKSKSKPTSDFPEEIANAQLIAAAPELLEALENIISIGKRDLSNEKYDGYFEAAHAAIAKAQGK